jgi:hypothetical protein
MFALWRKKMFKWLKSLFKRKSMTPEEILKSWAEFQKEPPQSVTTKGKKMATKTGLYANIHAKQERIKKEKAEGKPVEKMRKVGSKGAPTEAAFKAAAKTAKKK